ncbi:hypothetical protein FKM82_003914 [Ascaphus truei]
MADEFVNNINPLLGYKYMICEAILNSRGQKASTRQIDDFIRAKYPYYQDRKHARNFNSSIRFTLSSNDFFERDQDKLQHTYGFWKIAPEKQFLLKDGTYIVVKGIFIPNGNSNVSATTDPFESIRAAISAASIPETHIVQEQKYYDYVPSLSAENALEWEPEEMNLPPDQLFEESSGDSYERILEEICAILDSAVGLSVDENALHFWSDQLQPGEELILEE